VPFIPAVAAGAAIGAALGAVLALLTARMRDFILKLTTLAAGEALSVPLPLASLVRDRFLSAVARGEAGLDFTVIARQAAEAGGLKG